MKNGTSALVLIALSAWLVAGCTETRRTYISALVVVDDSYSTQPNQTLQVGAPGVLANDGQSGASLVVLGFDATTSGGGVAVISSDGSLRYTPAPGFSGVDTFAYRATGAGGQGSATVLVRVGSGVAATTLTAVDDVFHTAAGQSLEIVSPGVLANDVGTNQPTMVEHHVATTSQGGSVDLRTDGAFRYTPPSAFSGLDSFSYTAQQGDKHSEASVFVQVGNSTVVSPSGTPPAIRDDYYFATEDFELDVPVPGVLANDTLQASGQLTVTASDTTSARGGSVLVDSSGRLRYTPPSSYRGVDSFTYTASDGTNAATATVHLTITALPDFTEVRKASGPAGFGNEVDISGDTSVASTLESVNAQAKAGAVYVHNRNAGGADQWGQVRRLTSPSPIGDGLFGVSLGLSEDVLVVGESGAAGGGLAYVYERDRGGSNNWGLAATLQASDRQANDNFGGSVTIYGKTIAVGANNGESGGSADAGAAYVFTNNGTAWTQVKKLEASVFTSTDGRFGFATSLNGDTLVVGDNGADTPSAFRAGAVEIFARNQGGTNNWGLVARLVNPLSGAQTSAQFGSDVAIEGDVLFVSLFGKPQVYGYRRSGSAWNLFVTLTYPGSSALSGLFGRSLHLSGPVLLVAAPFDDTRGSSAGAVYSFQRNQGGANAWGLKETLFASDASAAANYGAGVALDNHQAAIGAHPTTSGVNGPGSLYFLKD